MDLRQLRYFVAVVDTGTFTAAARKCAIAQPSLSQQVMTLEDELGEPLLLRKSRGVELTEAGRLLYERACGVLKGSEDILDLFRRRDEELSGQVTIGVIPTVAPYLTPMIVNAFRPQFPSIHVHFREARTADMIRLVVDQDVDLGILSDVERAAKTRWSLHTRSLFHEAIVLAVPEGHVLARMRTVAAKDIDRDEVLHLTDGHCLRDQTPKRCRASGDEAPIECEQLTTLLSLVAAGLGVAFVPEMSLSHHSVTGIRFVRLQSPEPRREINVMKRRGKKLSAPGQALFDTLVGMEFRGS
ncbi:MAG: LysR substrate-binding domain-containing protein [Verrucomicrobiota bacterium]